MPDKLSCRDRDRLGLACAPLILGLIKKDSSCAGGPVGLACVSSCTLIFGLMGDSTSNMVRLLAIVSS